MSFFRGGFTLGLVLATILGQAQESVTQETNAPGIKWQQLNTPNFRILFPTGFDGQAQRMANTLEAIREPEGKSMGALPRKISVILQNQSALSNGFVTLAPRRSEFYTMPAQNYNFAGTNDWLNMLATHEYRHMVQFQRSKTGFNKLISYVFGQQAQAGMAFAAAPNWFWEGDAVATETAFTSSGRGRIPNFDLLFRTNLLEDRKFNYHKQYLRSYKHNIPNHYVLGYNMVSYLRKKTNDPMIWEKITARSWNVPFIPFAFSNAIKRETGLYVTDLFDEMARERKKDYEKALEGLSFTSFETVTKRTSGAYTDYLYPQVLENNKILVTKSGIGDIETLVVLGEEGEEESRYVQGPINDTGFLSAANQRVVWSEYRYDPRWLVHNYSVVKGYDFGSKQAMMVSSHSRYAAAALSPDGYRVATIESTNEYSNRLVLLDYFSGKVLKEFPNPTNDLLAMPRWTPDGKSLLVLRTTPSGKTISRIDGTTGTSEDLLPVSAENVGYPVVFGNHLLFNSPVSGIDNIYALELNSKERFQVTSSKYGAYNPAISLDGKTIYYNNQSRNGMDVVRAEFNPANWKKVEPSASSPNFLFQHLVDQEGHPNVLGEVKNTQYPVKRYHRSQGMINPHSWGPYFINSLTQLQIGIASQDILSTTNLTAGYVYDVNERTGAWQAKVSYQGQYPILDLAISKATRSVNEGNVEITTIKGTAKTVTNSTLKLNWNEQTVEGGFKIPLLTTSSKYQGNFTIGNSVGYTHVSDFHNSINNERIIPTLIRNDTVKNAVVTFNYQGNGNLVFNHFAMSGYRMLKQSRRDINSKWGQAFYLNAYNTPYGGDYSGRQFSMYGVLLFPGLMKHHSLWGTAGYQSTQISQLYRDASKLTITDNYDYQFRSQIPLPRGQSVARFQDFYSVSTNYTLPLWYPDAALGPVLNIQRVRANVFYDYGFGKSTFSGGSTSMAYSSAGIEMKFDLNIMRFLPQFNVGFRYSYGISPSVTLFEVLVGNINF